VTHAEETIIIRKNRKRAFWSMAIILLMVPVSGWLLVLGLQPGRPDISWLLVLFGAVGLIAFVGSAVAVLRVMRSPWYLALSPSCMALYAPTYDLEVPWDQVIGIAVDEVDRRPSCVLVFEDVDAVVQGATFHGKARRPDAVTDVAIMQARMEQSFDQQGYHLAIPGRILEYGPQELAELLVEARTGQLWREGEEER